MSHKETKILLGQSNTIYDNRDSIFNIESNLYILNENISDSSQPFPKIIRNIVKLPPIILPKKNEVILNETILDEPIPINEQQIISKQRERKRFNGNKVDFGRSPSPVQRIETFQEFIDNQKKKQNIEKSRIKNL